MTASLSDLALCGAVWQDREEARSPRIGEGRGRAGTGESSFSSLPFHLPRSHHSAPNLYTAMVNLRMPFKRQDSISAVDPPPAFTSSRSAEEHEVSASTDEKDSKHGEKGDAEFSNIAPDRQRRSAPSRRRSFLRPHRGEGHSRQRQGASHRDCRGHRDPLHLPRGRPVRSLLGFFFFLLH